MIVANTLTADKQIEIRRDRKRIQKQQAGKGKTTNRIILPKAVRLRMPIIKKQLQEEAQAELEIVLEKRRLAEVARIEEAAMSWIKFWMNAARKNGYCEVDCFDIEDAQVEWMTAFNNLREHIETSQVDVNPSEKIHYIQNIEKVPDSRAILIRTFLFLWQPSFKSNNDVRQILIHLSDK